MREITRALGALNAPPDGALEQFGAGPRRFRVAFEPSVYVRRAPLLAAPVARECAAGATVWADARWGAWLRVSESEGEWVLAEHPVHGRLVERAEESAAR